MIPINAIEPFLKAPRRVRTLGDAVDSIVAEWSLQPRELRNKNYDRVYRQRRVGEFLSEILGAEEHSIKLADVVDREADLIRHGLSRGLTHQDSVQYGCALRRILDHARKRGWNCQAIAVREAWRPVVDALHPVTEGCLQVVEHLISRGITPQRAREKHIKEWKESATADGLSPQAAEEREKRFRRKVRGLAHLLAHLNLESRKRPSFIIAPKDIPKSIQSELAHIQRFKTAEWMPGRSYHLAVSACTAEDLNKRFRQLLGFAIHILGITNIYTLQDLVVEAIVVPYIDFLENKRGLLRESLEHYIRPIHTVVSEHPLFRGRKYGWMIERLKKVPKEIPQNRKERKKAKFVPFADLACIPDELRALSRGAGLSPKEIAWHRHDELFWMLLLDLPLRLRNIRECGIQAPASQNLFHEKLNPRIWNDLRLPEWVKYAKDKPAQKFWILKFKENQMKARRAETKFVPLPAIALLEEYIAVHRRELVNENHDPGTLFLSRRGGALSEQAARRIVTDLSRQYARRISPHLLRDVVADETLRRGGSIEDVQDKLTHLDLETSWIYSRLNNTERGIDAVNQHFSSSEFSDMT